MYNPAKYWEQRLNQNFSLRGVGHQSYSLFYNKWLYKRKLQVLNSVFNPSNLANKSVLDVGTGIGFFLHWFMDCGARVSGIDISPSAIDHLTGQFPEMDLFLMDFSQPHIHLPQQYDVINAWDVVYHQTENSRFIQFLENGARFCKPGGYFICTDGFGMPQSVKVAEHVYFRNRDTYAGIMKQLEFELQFEKPLYKFLNRNYGSYRLRRYIVNSMAPIWYGLDQFQTRPARNNLSLSVWKKLEHH